MRWPRRPTDGPSRLVAPIARSRFWDAAGGHLLDQKSERQSGFVLDLAFRPDGQAIAIGLGDGTTGLADVAYPVERGIDEVRLWSQVTSNTRLDDQGNLVRLDHAAWSDAERALGVAQEPIAIGPLSRASPPRRSRTSPCSQCDAEFHRKVTHDTHLLATSSDECA